MIPVRSLETPTANHQIEGVRHHLQDIARNEISRYRRRLGILTPAQESAVETLLTSTTEQIFARFIEHIQNYPEDVQLSFARVWNSPA
jgi:hypothetical protein